MTSLNTDDLSVKLKRNKYIVSDAKSVTTESSKTSKGSKTNKGSTSKKRKQKSVPPPTKELLAWVMGMSQTKKRAEIAPGMRVKVRFTKPNLKWYGGVIALVSSTRSKVRIIYDDGTKEISNFPDKEIIVDDHGNGRHKVDASAFQPKDLLSTSIPLSVPTKKIVEPVQISEPSFSHPQVGLSVTSVPSPTPAPTSKTIEGVPSTDNPMEDFTKISSDEPTKNDVTKNDVVGSDKISEPIPPKSQGHLTVPLSSTTPSSEISNVISNTGCNEKEESTDTSLSVPPKNDAVEPSQRIQSGEESTSHSQEDLKASLSDKVNVTPSTESVKQDEIKTTTINRRHAKGVKRVPQEELPEQKLSSKKRRNEKGEDGRRRKKRIDETATVDNENWVQCERCMKWRLIPSVENLPDKWYCEMNETDPGRNTCDAPQQTQEDVAKLRRKQAKKNLSQSNTIRLKRPKSQSPMNVPIPSGVKPEKGKTMRSSPVVQNSFSELTNGSDSADEYVQDNDNNQRQQGNKPKKKGRKPKEAKQQEWVQCEKCDKWRRLPSHIKAKDLPEIWYCSMNTWDPRSASCAVQDDFKADTTKTKPAPDRGFMGGPQKTSVGSKLTYRDLIRKPTRPISEKMRAAESIFSSHAAEHEGEASGPPVVTYFNSSAFQQKIGINRANMNNNNYYDHLPAISEVTLFSLMRHSKLWKDLSKVDTASVKSEISGGSMSMSTNLTSSSSSMKEMVHYALGRGTMTADEVLFECQCGDWKDMPWMNLRASCTIESIMKALYELEKDGLIEKVESVDEVGSGDFMNVTVERFRHVMIEGMPQSDPGLSLLTPYDNMMDVENEVKTPKFTKFSKPWKKHHSLIAIE